MLLLQRRKERGLFTPKLSKRQIIFQSYWNNILNSVPKPNVHSSKPKLSYELVRNRFFSDKKIIKNYEDTTNTQDVRIGSVGFTNDRKSLNSSKKTNTSFNHYSLHSIDKKLEKNNRLKKIDVQNQENIKFDPEKWLMFEEKPSRTWFLLPICSSNDIRKGLHNYQVFLNFSLNIYYNVGMLNENV